MSKEVFYSFYLPGAWCKIWDDVHNINIALRRANRCNSIPLNCHKQCEANLMKKIWCKKIAPLVLLKRFHVSCMFFINTCEVFISVNTTSQKKTNNSFDRVSGFSVFSDHTNIVLLKLLHLVISYTCNSHSQPTISLSPALQIER